MRIDFEPPENKLEKGVVSPPDRPSDGTTSLMRLEAERAADHRAATQQSSLADGIGHAAARGALGRIMLDGFVTSAGARANSLPPAAGSLSGIGAIPRVRGP